MRTRYRLLLGLVATAISVIAIGWFISQPRTLPVTTPDRLAIDDSPLATLIYNADRLTLDGTAALAPGRYALDAGGGRWTLEVPFGCTLIGGLAARVTARGEESGQRWITVEPEPGSLTATPPILVTSPNGLTAEVSLVSASGAGLAVAVDPLVARSLTAWVVGKVWATVPAGGTVVGNPIRDVTVSRGSMSLHDGGRLGWREAVMGTDSVLVMRAGSVATIYDLAVSEAGEIDNGRVSLRLVVARGSLVQAGEVTASLDDGELTAVLDVRRTAGGAARIAQATGTVATLTASHPRVGLAGAVEFGADQLVATFDAFSWERQVGHADAVTVGGQVELIGVHLPGPVGAAMGRLASVTATVASGGDALTLDRLRVAVATQAVAAAASAAVPTALTLPDVPVAANVLDLFRDIRLSDVTVEMGRPALTVDGDRFAFAASPVIRGRIKALGRQDVVTMRTQEVEGPFGIRVKTTLPFHEVSWVPRIDLPFAVPVTLAGRATVGVVPSAILADATIRVTTVCDAASIGEPTVEGLGEPLKSAVKLASLFRERVKVDGQTLPEHLTTAANRNVNVPLFGPMLDKTVVDLLRRVVLRDLAIAREGDYVVFTASVVVKGP